MATPKRKRATEVVLTKTEQLSAAGARRFGWFWLKANKAAIRVLHEAGIEPQGNTHLGMLIATEVGRYRLEAINEVCDEVAALLAKQPNEVNGPKLYDEIQAILVQLKENAK